LIALWITYEIEPEIFEEKRGNAALLFKNFRFYFIFDPKEISEKEYPHFLREGAAKQAAPSLKKWGYSFLEIA